jgi:hypothetical protein
VALLEPILLSPVTSPTALVELASSLVALPLLAPTVPKKPQAQ